MHYVMIKSMFPFPVFLILFHIRPHRSFQRFQKWDEKEYTLNTLYAPLFGEMIVCDLLLHLQAQLSILHKCVIVYLLGIMIWPLIDYFLPLSSRLILLSTPSLYRFLAIDTFFFPMV